jgi:hypothetical protein
VISTLGSTPEEDAERTRQVLIQHGTDSFRDSRVLEIPEEPRFVRGFVAKAPWEKDCNTRTRLGLRGCECMGTDATAVRLARTTAMTTARSRTPAGPLQTFYLLSIPTIPGFFLLSKRFNTIF